MTLLTMLTPADKPAAGTAADTAEPVETAGTPTGPAPANDVSAPNSPADAAVPAETDKTGQTQKPGPVAVSGTAAVQ